MNTYADFLARKATRITAFGVDTVPDLDSRLFGFQKHIVALALRKGRFAVFSDCGTGKSPMALAWAKVVARETGKPVLILTPLAVAAQFVREGIKWDVPVRHIREADDWCDGIMVMNYERLEKVAHLVSELGGIVLDESSILKNFDGKTRTRLIEAFRDTRFKLALTATPSPNDVTELGNHAEFLSVTRHVDMLNRFFEHAGDDTSKWTLKGHARKPFWRWVSQWAICLSKPSDMGYPDDGYELPPLSFVDHVIDVDQKMAHKAGLLFAYQATTLTEQREVRRASIDERVSAVASVVMAEPQEQWLVWGSLNDETQAIAKAIPGAVEIAGSDSAEEKEKAILDFLDGRIRYLVTKCSILAMGVNAQCCARQCFAGADHSFEAVYQAMRRSLRFGQTRPVNIHFVITSADGRITHNLQRKQAEAEAMKRELVEVMREAKG